MSSTGKNRAVVNGGDAATNLLPPPPPNVPPDLTRATAKYKRHAWIAGFGLLAFVALYLFLTGWFCWTAYRLITFALGPAREGVWPFVAGVLSALLGAFLLSAMFFIKTGGDAKSNEITAQDEPELFTFLNALADRVGAPRPHRVFLSSRVNAGVFYDLSFANLLLPTKKNLEIGLGLVNSLTLSEFTAVLAHEFGHFAQRSMAVGRWVYTAQQVAGQIVVARSWLDKLLAGLSTIDIRVAWIGWIMRLVVWSIRSLLDTAFRLVVLAERALGREMEFQADLVSVSVTGSDALVHALHRLGAADEAWNVALSVMAREASRGRMVPDLFALQSRVIEHTARILNEPDHGASPKLPTEHPEEHRVFEQELAEPPRMWSTHPPNRDRELNAKRVYVPAELDSRSAFCLFRNPEKLRRDVTTSMLSTLETKLEKGTEESALAAVDERFGSTLFHERYRGIYLGRAIGLATKTPAAMVGQAVDVSTLRERFAELYPESLAGEIRDFRVQSNERAALEALRDGILDAPGGIIQHRGRAIPRRKLAGVIEEVTAEVNAMRDRIEAHDRSCRAVHLAAARALGQGWEAYLVGLIRLHHYTAHVEANLGDARGYLANVFAVVTADGRVSPSERTRLITACVEVHSALREIYGHRQSVRLPDEIFDRLWKAIGAKAEKERPKKFSALLENEFSLPHANEQNIGEWLQVIDSWVDDPMHIFGTLERVSLEMLVEAEHVVRRAFEEESDPGAAPEAPIVPDRYQTLTRSERRERQKQLDLWNRFQIADGFFPTLGRLVVAGGILGAVMVTASHADEATGAKRSNLPMTSGLTIVNGLDVPVVVDISGQTIHVPARERAQATLSATHEVVVRTRLEIGDEIESFRQLVQAPRDYVYNIAGATPLLQRAERIGTKAQGSSRWLGAPKWYSAVEDMTFESWRLREQRAAMGGVVQVRLGTPFDAVPDALLSNVEDPAERNQIILAHASWDSPSSRWIRVWLGRARDLPRFDELLNERLTRYPHDVFAWEVKQDRAKDADRKRICDDVRKRAEQSREDVDWLYLSLRCDHDPSSDGKAFLDEFRKHQYHPYLADIAANEFLRQGKYSEAIAALEVSTSVSALAEERSVYQARLMRVANTPKLDDKFAQMAQQSVMFKMVLDVEFGQGSTPATQASYWLGVGRLSDAMAIAKTDPVRLRDIFVFVAASEGAPRMYVDEFLKLPAIHEVTDATWAEIALLDREGRAHADLDALVKQNSGAYAEKVLPFGTLGFLKKGRGIVDTALAKLPLDQQAAACVMALVRDAALAPKSCRALVNAYYFFPEKPHFKN